MAIKIAALDSYYISIYIHHIIYNISILILQLGECCGNKDSGSFDQPRNPSRRSFQLCVCVGGGGDGGVVECGCECACITHYISNV